MPTTLANFYQQLSDNIGRGDTFDSKIPAAVAKAARDLEIKFSFGYMQQAASIEFASLTSQAIYDLLGDTVKKLSYVRAVGVGSDLSESYSEIPKGQLGDLVSRQDTIATYWTNASYYSRLDLGWYAYTDWPESLSASPDLLQSYESLLEAASMVVLATKLRDDSLITFWNNPNNPLSYKNLMDAALLAEQEAENAAESVVMQPYVPR